MTKFRKLTKPRRLKERSDSRKPTLGEWVDTPRRLGFPKFVLKPFTTSDGYYVITVGGFPEALEGHVFCITELSENGLSLVMKEYVDDSEREFTVEGGNIQIAIALRLGLRLPVEEIGECKFFAPLDGSSFAGVWFPLERVPSSAVH